MPSPLGHALAGLSVGLVADAFPDHRASTASRGRWALPLAAGAVAVSPDLDLLFEHFSVHVHRSASHSVLATLLIFIVTMVVTGEVTRRTEGEANASMVWRWATTLALAHLSHVLMDWLGQDQSPPYGLQVFWPLSDNFYTSGIDLFPSTDRRLRTSPTAWQTNLWALFVESLLMTPVALLAAWWWQRRRRGSGASA